MHQQWPRGFIVGTFLEALLHGIRNALKHMIYFGVSMKAHLFIYTLPLLLIRELICKFTKNTMNKSYARIFIVRIHWYISMACWMAYIKFQCIITLCGIPYFIYMTDSFSFTTLLIQIKKRWCRPRILNLVTHSRRFCSEIFDENNHMKISSLIHNFIEIFQNVFYVSRGVWDILHPT